VEHVINGEVRRVLRQYGVEHAAAAAGDAVAAQLEPFDDEVDV
jgi:hypothetical protein